MQLTLRAALQAILISALSTPTNVNAETPFYNPEYPSHFVSVPVVDRGVIAAANFAANTHTIIMVDVVTARQQIVAGKNYALCLRIKDKKMDAHPRLVMTKIYKPSGKPYQIKSWTRVNNCTSDE